MAVEGDSEDTDFDTIAPAQAELFGNARVSADQLASANRVRQHAIDSSARATTIAADEEAPPPAQ